MPVGQKPRDGVLERFGQWNFFALEARVARIASRVAFVVRTERRGGDVINAPPDLDLRIAVLGGGFRLVQSLQCSVMTLVQTPALELRNPHLVERVQRDPQ